MKMGVFKSEITLSNPILPELKSLKVTALVDTGALHLCLPEHLVFQLGLKELEKREVTLADGRKFLASYVGPLEVSFENRRCFVGAMVLGTEPLLGAIPLEDMDLIVDPARRQLTVNPENPNIPGSQALYALR
jgi:clan AA aspartic protease